MDTLATGVHYGLIDFPTAMQLDLEEWEEFVVLVEKVGAIKQKEFKQYADYVAGQTANKLTPNIASLVKTMMKVMGKAMSRKG